MIINCNENGTTKLASYEYDAFGNQKSRTGTWNASNPIRYCGEYYDSESGLIYLRARYYDSENGRFISEDPAKDGYNWYSYCGGNPVMFVDPSGLDAIVANQTENVAGYGHMSAFVQDNNGDWYFFYWGNDSVVLKKVDDPNVLKDSESLNNWLETNGLNKGEYKYDAFCYIIGDFSESKDYYQNLADEFDDNIANNKVGWFGFKNRNYNLATRNCTQETMKGLYKGKIGVNKEQTVGQINKRHGYGIAVIPNNNLYNLQSVYGSKSLNWWE